MEEKSIQQQISQYLGYKGIEFINPPMHRKSALPEGWGDFTFAYRGVPFVLEVKTEEGKQTPEQVAMGIKLNANGWKYRVVRSLAEVKEMLDIIERDQ